MLNQFKASALAVGMLLSLGSIAQTNQYTYSLDLTQPQNDQLKVELKTPKVTESQTTFYMPKIIPGTYRESDYGKFVSDLKAFDKKGRALPVTRLNDNAWQIDKANKMTSISYMVEDIFDTDIENNVYYMSGSNIDEGNNFVIQTSAFFGYLKGMKEIPFTINITKPESFYGSTGLIPTSTSATKDVYTTGDYDLLMDSPMMYNKPDTTVIKVANADVLVSVYSPNGLVTSEFLAEKFKELLAADATYLGGKLPVEKYAFIMYFESPQTARMDRAGALEHSYSSFYYMPEQPQQYMASILTDIAAHEFFHIVTPLTIHSEEIENFNYNEPVLSQHLWLYEGVTEYSSDHVQVRHGLITPEQFIKKLNDKLVNSQSSYNDTLAFTKLSKEAASTYRDEYGNVYEKGALIAALLDIRLLELSDGKMNLQDLLRKLTDKYGKNKPFKDDALFDEIASLSFPQIKEYLETYVAGNKSLPYKEYFNKVGLTYSAGEITQVASLGKIQLGFNQEKMRIFVQNADNMNSFGQAMGFKEGDIILSLQGQDMQPMAAQQIFEKFSTNTKAGEIVKVVVNRADESGEYEEVELSAPAVLVDKAGKADLSFNPDATPAQKALQFAWMNASPVNIKDVAELGSIINSLYDVISGDMGAARDWGRFQALFAPNATMTAVVSNGGKSNMASMTPEQYQEQNTEVFKTTAFYEEELGRKVTEFNGVATVLSAYQFRLQKGGEVAQRGVNSIQAVYHDNRWWITSIVWSSETPENKIPDELTAQK